MTILSYLKKQLNVYKKIYGDESKATVVHAGLECSYIVKKYDGAIDCISIGPTIVNSHTGGERLQVATVKQFYETVTNLIPTLF